MMEYKNLSNITIGKLTEVFNKSFSDYLLPFHLTESNMNNKIILENIRLEYSVGTFKNNELVGFILIGINTINSKLIAYNAGTGVIPDERGNNNTVNMYQLVFHLLKEVKIKKHLLEVLTENKKATKVYEKVGFSHRLILNCYKGFVSEPIKRKVYTIEQTSFDNIKEKESKYNYNIAYQNRYNILKNDDDHIIFSAFDKNLIIGYVIFSKSSLRLKQLWIKPNYRRKGIANWLFYEVNKLNPKKEVSIINIDNSDLDTNLFLIKIGLRNYINQYQMEIK